jgi:hypothetical protein
MGMFDNIKVDVVLPDETSVKDTWFQTKSLENIMTYYVITEDGKLCQDIWDYEYIEDSTHFLGGYMNRIEDSYRTECYDDYHGDIRFYGDALVDDNKRTIYRDYTARFTNGKLEKITYNDIDCS